eukprot:g2819.t1
MFVKGRRKLIQETTSFTAKTLRLKKDQVHVKDREWKALQLRAEMPSKVPPGGHHRLLSMAKNQGRTNNLEEVPETFVQKVPVIPDAGRSGDGYLTRSMNQKLSSTSRDLQQLQAAHRSHTAFHYHVEEMLCVISTQTLLPRKSNANGLRRHVTVPSLTNSGT